MMDSNAFQPTDSLVGKLLVASTTVQDPMLSHSVSLIVHQDAENVFAVLLNRPMAAPPGLTQMLESGKQETSSRMPRMSHDGDNAQEESEDEAAFNEIAAANAEQTAKEVAKALGTIHFGGPLSGPVVAIHSSSAHAEAETGQGVYVAADRSVLETLVKQKPGPYRLIVGHLGWTSEQLQAECEAGYWHVIDATEQEVFTRDDMLWPTVIRRATTRSMARWLGIANLPQLAECN
ncbi:YqgE/AlgH family protein [Rhodopirellula sp. MGV]|uniref:YqgE/AlgH family protein n=1 Tax=Rhodopirellula sp. MGV TaxID=2023130 RepID=UPI0013046C26|nr:YqgE/AlgH family protein [Rhodopirellula sp. MGV]